MAFMYICIYLLHDTLYALYVKRVIFIKSPFSNGNGKSIAEELLRTAISIITDKNLRYRYYWYFEASEILRKKKRKKIRREFCETECVCVETGGTNLRGKGEKKKKMENFPQLKKKVSELISSYR